MRYREDFEVGEVPHLGSRTVGLEPSRRVPGRGTVVMDWQAVNQRGEVVLRMTGRGLFGCRTPAAAEPDAE